MGERNWWSTKENSWKKRSTKTYRTSDANTFFKFREKGMGKTLVYSLMLNSKNTAIGLVLLMARKPSTKKSVSTSSPINMVASSFIEQVKTSGQEMRCWLITVRIIGVKKKLTRNWKPRVIRCTMNKKRKRDLVIQIVFRNLRIHKK